MFGTQQFSTPFQRFALVFIFITFAGFYITPEIANQLIPVRFIVLAVLVILTALSLPALRSGYMKKGITLFLFVYSFLIVYGVLLASLFGGLEFFSDLKLIAFMLVSLLFSVAVSSYYDDCMSRHEFCHTSKLLDVFFLSGLVFILLNNGVIFPSFIAFAFERPWYSQATTSLFGLGAIYFMYKASFNNFRLCTVYYILALVFFLFSLLGGGRGDFMVMCVVFVLISLRLFSFRFNFGSAAVILMLTVLFLTFFSLNDLTLFKRFELLNLPGVNTESIDMGRIDTRGIDISQSSSNVYNRGVRGLLLHNGIDLLKNNSDCLLTGCGFNYFQKYFDVEFGLYPHNIFLEFIITYGVIIGVPILSLILIGVWRGFFGPTGTSFVFYFCLLQLGLGFKSGSLVGMTLMPVCLYFCYCALLPPKLKKLEEGL